VDDLLIFSKDLKVIERLKEFEMKDLWEFEFFLRIQVIRDQKSKTIKLGQPKYVKEILKWFNIKIYNPMFKTLEVNNKLRKPILPNTLEEIEEMKKILCKKIIGYLLYAMVATKPNLSNLVNVVS
jgi:hypothetical protein